MSFLYPFKSPEGKMHNKKCIFFAKKSRCANNVLNINM